jgi:hypothetical protein
MRDICGQQVVDVQGRCRVRLLFMRRLTLVVVDVLTQNVDRNWCSRVFVSVG